MHCTCTQVAFQDETCRHCACAQPGHMNTFGESECGVNVALVFVHNAMQPINGYVYMTLVHILHCIGVNVPYIRYTICMAIFGRKLCVIHYIMKDKFVLVCLLFKHRPFAMHFDMLSDEIIHIAE